MLQHNDCKSVLISADDIKKKVEELGKKITADYEGKNLTVICILKGASVFFADLVRQIDLPMQLDFMATSSYASGTASTGEVKLTKDCSAPLGGRDVIIVEDIIDSGLTLAYLKKLLVARGVSSIALCTLLDKPERRKVDLRADYFGFIIPNEFVVGYGLDYDEKYRNIPDICVLKPEIYTK